MSKRRSRTDADAAAEPHVTNVATLFPASVVAGNIVRRRRLRRARSVVLAAVVVAAVVVAGLAVRASRSTSPSYRTTTAADHEVQAQLDGVATIEPVSQAQVAFPMAGTVSSVDVALGATVTAGQTLATLDTSSLVAALHQAQSTLDAAKLTLSKALAGDSVSLPSTGTAQGVAYRTGEPATAVFLAAITSDATSDLTAAENAVLAAQQKVDSARSDAASALKSATTVCAAVGQAPAGGGTGSGTGTGGTGTGTSDTGAITACQTALNNVLAAQNTVDQAQSNLANASTALDNLLKQIAKDTTSTTTSPPTTQPPRTTEAPPTTTIAPTTPTTSDTSGSQPSHHPTTSTTVPGDTSSTSTPPTSTARSGGGSRSGGFSGGGGSGGGGSGGGGSGGSGVKATPPTAADLVAYQSAVDDATAQVTVAQQAIAQATIVSPIGGTVVSLNLTKGQSTTAASTTQNVVIQGAGGYEATTTVSLNNVSDVKVGQPAAVTPDGGGASVNGKVVSISAVPASTTSTTTYGVVIALPPDASGLENGAIGSVAITTGTSASKLAVPTSAVTTAGAVHTVTVLDGTTTRRVVVQVGVVGPTWTEIVSGVTAGEQVVLADLSQPLPSSASNTATNTNTNAARRAAAVVGAGGLGGFTVNGAGLNRGAGTGRTP